MIDALQPLPLPLQSLPESLQRFGDPNAPGPAKMMAAKGLVPVKGSDLVFLLVQLSADKEQATSKAASESLAGLPPEMLIAACSAPIHASILDRLATNFASREDVLERLMLNGATSSATVARVARNAPELLTEVIATNQQRLLAAPEIIEALYKNPKTRMSTADRLVELAARNNVDLSGIPAFKAHAEAIRGELIPEPSDEPLPSDSLFSEALAADSDDADVEGDAPLSAEEEAAIKDAFKPLSFRIAKMRTSEKLRLAMVGNAAARALLIRDKSKQVSMAAIGSPQMTDTEAVPIARSKEVSEDILRFIANRSSWMKNYELKRALVFNPKTPTGISLKFLAHMMPGDLKDLARSKNIAAPIKSAALQRMNKMEKK